MDTPFVAPPLLLPLSLLLSVPLPLPLPLPPSIIAEETDRRPADGWGLFGVEPHWVWIDKAKYVQYSSIHRQS